VRLFEHPDFDQVILQAAEHFQLRPGIIEKDYYVTEVLRIIAATAGDKVIFKGGTSLSKGWNLIQRFSEDIDIFLDPLAFEPPLTKRGIDRELKGLRDAVATHPALQFVPEESQTIGGFGRNDRFCYHQLYGGSGEVASRVLLEAGAASGREPTVSVELRSYLGQFLQEKGIALGTEDESSFPMRLLHFRRTFVEKMFAIHSKVEILKRDGHALGTYARHYYDLFQLASQDYDRISRTYFSGSYFYPDQMSFANSDALFATGDLSAAIGREYKGQCEILCFTSHPSWEIVQARFVELRNLL
jgi:hypothetical protein